MITNITHTVLISFIVSSSTALASSSSVEHVVVFADRAQVSRLANAKCRDSSAKLEFTGLPARLDHRTLRATASDGATVIGVNFEVRALVQSEDERVRKLDDEIEKLERELAKINDDLRRSARKASAAEEYSVLLQSIINKSLATPKVDAKQWKAAMDYLRRERDEADKMKIDLGVRQKEVNRQSNVLQRKRAHFVSQAQTSMVVASVTLSCGRQKSPKVRLSYVVPGATWQPEYDLRVTPPKGRKVGPSQAELTIAAVIRQSTGEDWTNARIVLSTAQPRLGSTAPLPAPLYVRGREVEEPKALVQAQESRKKLSQGKAPQSKTARVELEDQGQSFALKLPGRVTVRADGRAYWMPVDTLKARAKVILTSVPKLRPFVYQMASLNNPAQHPLLAGPVHVYRSGAYIGDVQLEYRGPGEPMEVSLGIDQDLRIERSERHAMNRGAGFMSSDKHLDRSYRITTHNQSTKPVTVQIRENIPVSKIKDVRVEINKKDTTAGYELDAYRGFLSWTVELKQDQSKDVDLAYTVHVPESWKLR